MCTIKQQKKDEMIKNILPQLNQAIETIVKQNDTKLVNQIHQDFLKAETLQEKIWILEALEENI